MEKKLKLKLDDIKVESFITSMDENMSNNIKGMGATNPTGCNTCPTCGGTFCNANTCAATCPTCATGPMANCCVA
jgi:hypothetical protein